VADECAFWMSDESSANVDVEIINAVRPGLATTSGMMVLASSPYSKRGILFDTYRRHYGETGDKAILVAQGASRDFNPSLPQSVVDRAMERDAAAASAEFLGQFRTDIEALLTREAVEACISFDVRERPPMSSVRYYAFCDPSGGSADSMTIAIGHKEDNVVVIDVIRERRPPFSPEDVVEEFCELLETYRVTKIQGDRYAGEWPIERFRVHQIVYEPSAKPKSDLYRDLLPLVNGRRIDLLDHTRMLQQLCGLERRTMRGTGRDSIDHAPGGHDDISNAVAGLAGLARLGGYDSSLSWVSGPYDPEEAARSHLDLRMMQHIARYGGRRY
jgi:hypothetical protein